jgi:hypothetical protein
VAELRIYHAEVDRDGKVWRIRVPEVARTTRRAARRLRDHGLPLQDVGQALGVSFQRAKQLIDEADKLAS